MTKKIFRSLVALSAAVLLICILCISYVLYGYFGEIISDELKAEANLISQEIRQDEGYLEDMQTIENRITLIDADGTVLFDSQAEAATMENHGNREEVREAAKNGQATVTRYSDTLATKTIYYAEELEDGKILRIAQDQSMVMLLLRGVVGPVAAIFMVILILAAVLSRAISKRIVKPINEMDLSDKDAEEPYMELAPLVVKIRQQNRHIGMQMAELERRQKEFTTITENMSEGFLLIDRNTEILSYNRAALELLGAEDAVAGEKPHTAFELNRSKGFRTAVEKALAGKHSQQPLETESRYYQIIANPVSEQGEVVGAVVIVMDVTEKEQRDKLRREFTSNVSHELKTPLTTIYGVADMLAEGIIKQEDLKSFGKTIKDESGRMIHLIDDIIRLSMLDEDSVQDAVSKVDLFETAKEVIERLTLTAEERSIALYLEGDSAVIEGVPSLCDEILYNLCENAIKYNKDCGSVTVAVKMEKDGAVLSVEDTGPGIPYEFRERIFERFFRVDKSHSRNVGGTGLGLSIVKHAVIRMKGTIQVESIEGAGTKMIVRLPHNKSKNGDTLSL
ncbi:MAG: ATP-binding protein [Bacillota bacterium]|nr:ATP-binding protein [Bacillota bacterium]